MARSFSSAEARQLIAEHTALQSELSGAIGRIEEMQAVVRSAVEAYRSEKALDLLREIPIEEVNRNKLGLRVKALRESGICTMAVACTSSNEKRSIRAAFASLTLLEARISLITSSIKSRAVLRPSKICARSRAFLRSKAVLRSIISH